MSVTVIACAVPTADADRLASDPGSFVDFTRYGNPAAVSMSLEEPSRPATAPGHVGKPSTILAGRSYDRHDLAGFG